VPVINVPHKDKARTKRVQMDVSTGSGEGKVKDTVEVDLPVTLGDAVALYEEEYVMRCFIGYHVINLQAKERSRLQKERSGPGGTKRRKRGRYLDELGL